MELGRDLNGILKFFLFSVNMLEESKGLVTRFLQHTLIKTLIFQLYKPGSKILFVSIPKTSW